ncbi:MAG TPA: GNAT family N-acetyltransferase, partial [Terriglobales bacterium]|nr:GNAT family N-acetyltransferase [Terriglobales bacterium]
IEQARQLFQEYAASLGFSLCFQGFDKELAGLPGDYAPPHGRLLLAEVDGQVAGCAGLHPFGPSEDKTCEVKRLFVRPEFRGQQIGKQLMDAVLEAAREIGYRRMLLDTVSGTMDKAIAMYRQYEFREVESYRVNPMAGVVYMELALIPRS